MITLNDLADRAKKGNWTITNDEAVTIWTYIPEGCERIKKLPETLINQDLSFFPKSYIERAKSEYLHIKGLGDFKIEESK